MVDLDDGFTRIANELLEAILRFGFKKQELLIVFAVARKTYGFNKKSDDIALGQLSKMTGLQKTHISTVISNLAKMNVLLKREGVYGYVIGLNKNYGEWRGLPKRESLPKQYDTVTETVTNRYRNGKQQKTTPKDNSNIKAGDLKIPVPADFALGETNQKWLTDEGLPEGTQKSILRDFIDYWTLREDKKTPKGWQMTFRKNPVVKSAIAKYKHQLNKPRQNFGRSVSGNIEQRAKDVKCPSKPGESYEEWERRIIGEERKQSHG